MENKEETKHKEVKILKCIRCGKEYIFDSDHKRCPECKGDLQEQFKKYFQAEG